MLEPSCYYLYFFITPWIYIILFGSEHDTNLGLVYLTFTLFANLRIFQFVLYMYIFHRIRMTPLPFINLLLRDITLDGKQRTWFCVKS